MKENSTKKVSLNSIPYGIPYPLFNTSISRNSL
nr:MAG TPA: hypothetical protein [Caudoviricetes sp.]